MGIKNRTSKVKFSGGITNSGTGFSPIPPNRPTTFSGELTVSATRSDPGPVPGYRLKIANGDNACTPLTGRRTVVKIDQGDYLARIKTPSGTFNWTGIHGAFSEPVGTTDFHPDPTLALNRAKTKFVQKALSAQSALQTGVFLGEIRETIGLIRRPAMGLRRGLDDFFSAARKRRKGSRRHKAKVLEELWLEYSFGWKPLISDLDAIASDVARFVHRPPPFEWVEAFGSSRVQQNFTSLPNFLGVLSWMLDVIGTSTVGAKIYGVVNLDTEGPSMKRVGLALDQFVPTVWELIPYSFLIDYFTNIGDVIQGWSFSTSRLRWSYQTTRWMSRLEKRTHSPRVDTTGLASGSSGMLYSGSHCSSTSDLIDFVRGPVGSLVPDFRLEVPGFNTKWLNIAALARTRREFNPY